MPSAVKALPESRKQKQLPSTTTQLSLSPGLLVGFTAESLRLEENSLRSKTNI